MVSHRKVLLRVQATKRWCGFLADLTGHERQWEQEALSTAQRGFDADQGSGPPALATRSRLLASIRFIRSDTYLQATCPKGLLLAQTKSPSTLYSRQGPRRGRPEKTARILPLQPPASMPQPHFHTQHQQKRQRQRQMEKEAEGPKGGCSLQAWTLNPAASKGVGPAGPLRLSG